MKMPVAPELALATLALTLHGCLAQSGPQPAFQTAADTAVAADSAADADATAPADTPAKGACVRPSDCAAAERCIAGQCKAAITCQSHKQCVAAGAVCAQSDGVCVDCAEPADCAKGLTCVANVCANPSAAAACASSKECGKDNVCDKTAGKCVECLEDLDCAAAFFCSGGLCAPRNCPNGLCAGAPGADAVAGGEDAAEDVLPEPDAEPETAAVADAAPDAKVADVKDAGPDVVADTGGSETKAETVADVPAYDTAPETKADAGGGGATICGSGGALWFYPGGDFPESFRPTVAAGPNESVLEVTSAPPAFYGGANGALFDSAGKVVWTKQWGSDGSTGKLPSSNAPPARVAGGWFFAGAAQTSGCYAFVDDNGAVKWQTTLCGYADKAAIAYEGAVLVFWGDSTAMYFATYDLSGNQVGTTKIASQANSSGSSLGQFLGVTASPGDGAVLTFKNGLARISLAASGTISWFQGYYNSSTTAVAVIDDGYLAAFDQSLNGSGIKVANLARLDAFGTKIAKTTTPAAVGQNSVYLDLAGIAGGAYGVLATGYSPAPVQPKKEARFVRLTPWGGVQLSRALPTTMDYDGALTAHILPRKGGAWIALGRGKSSPSSKSAFIYAVDEWGYASCSDAGKCANLPFAACDDGNPCTTDDCQPDAGCVHQPMTVYTPCGPKALCDGSGACITATCGNKACELGENNQSCPTDCSKPACGNGKCESGESGSCASDCQGCQIAATPGCGACSCSVAVCAVYPECCNQGWKDYCVSLCMLAAPAQCPP